MNGLSLSHLALENVERLRTARGLTLADLANEAGITAGYLRLLRSVNGGERAISLDVLARLARALDVHPYDLLRPRSV